MTEDSPIRENLRAALAAQFGFESFNPGQLEVMEHLMAGRSAAAVFATGAGKSLCYQLPATLLPGLTLVVSPLIALMKDQVGALQARGIDAHALDSSLSTDEYREVMRGVRSGTTRLLYVAPERFNNERFRQALLDVPISLFAVDEAHCISEWGHNFRPDYLKLAVFAREFGAERLLALTATATDPVLHDICESLEIAPECAIRTPFFRANLSLLATPTKAADRDEALLDRIRGRASGPTIVYVTLQRSAEQVADMLRKDGLSAKAYHAGMKPEARTATQDWFMGSDEAIVVATIAFGMGIDKLDIRYVYHYNLPKSLENYSQEVGRAGRDGLPSTCEMLACADDMVVLENFVYGDTPTLGAIVALLEELFSLGEAFDISLYTLGRDHEIRPLVLRTLLTYLELRGHIEAGTPFYSVYEFKPVVPSATMLIEFEEGERSLVRSVLAQSKKARSWFHVDAHETSRTLGVDRSRVVRVFDRLAEIQLIELRSKGVRHRYRVVEAPPNLHELAEQLHTQAHEREGAEIGRLHQVLELIGADGCQASVLGAHFSEPLPQDCGHCSWCRSRVATPLEHGHGAPIEAGAWAKAIELRESLPDVLGEPRAFAQLVCGIASPTLTKAKLSKHALFGSQRGVSFAQVLQRARE